MFAGRNPGVQAIMFTGCSRADCVPKEAHGGDANRVQADETFRDTPAERICCARLSGRPDNGVKYLCDLRPEFGLNIDRLTCPVDSARGAPEQ